MASLDKLASLSPLMEIDITYNGKRYRFNLYQETQINAETLNREVKKHPSSYSFLLQLRNNLEKRSLILEKDKDRLYNRLYIKYKKMNNPLTGRPLSDDAAKAKALASKEYDEAVTKWIESVHNFKTLRDAIKAYEVRKDLMQTLGANMRNER